MALSEEPLAAYRARIARYIDRLSYGTAGRKSLHFLETIAWAWSPERRSCFGAVKHHVEPTRDDVLTVAELAGAKSHASVRVAALAAIAHAGELARLGLEALRVALPDSDRRVRLIAARVAVETGLGSDLAPELRARLSDDVWAIRWYAARALTPRAYDAELGAFSKMLIETTPRGGMSLAGWAHAVDAVRPRARTSGQANDLDEHVRAVVASLKGRDRDFVWLLRD